MLKTREILRLKNEVGLSLREIAQACTVARRQYQRYSSGLKRLE